jgi:hypothetical protein
MARIGVSMLADLGELLALTHCLYIVRGAVSGAPSQTLD